MNLVYISYIIALSSSTDTRNIDLACDGIHTDKDQILIVELTSDGRAEVSKANIAPVDEHWYSFQALMVGKLCDCHG